MKQRKPLMGFELTTPLRYELTYYFPNMITTHL